MEVVSSEKEPSSQKVKFPSKTVLKVEDMRGLEAVEEDEIEYKGKMKSRRDAPAARSGHLMK